MKDINFFEMYKEDEKIKIEPKKNKDLNKIFAIIGVIVLFTAILGYEILFFMNKRNLNKEIKTIETELNSSSKQKKYREILGIKKDINSLEKLENEIIPSMNIIMQDFYFTSEMMTAIIMEIPEDTYLESVEANDGRITINAITSKYDSAAQYLFNIKTSNKLFKDAFIPSITESEGDFRYSINIVLDEMILGGGFNEKTE